MLDCKTLLLRARRKFSSAFFKPYTLSTKILNETFPFYIGNFEGSLWYGKHKDSAIADTTPELQWTQKQILPGEIFFDIGAHHGYFSLLYSRWVGSQGKVYAFECHPQNYEILKTNRQLNQADNLEIFSSAVGEANGKISIGNDSSGILLAQQKTVTVPMITLDHFAEQHRTPTMMKIDVEGYELEVLLGAKKILATRPKVILEIHNFAHSDPKPRLEAILELFKGYRHQFYQTAPGEPIQSGSIDLLAHPNPHLYLIP